MKVRILLYSLVCFVSCTWLSCTEDGNGLAYETDTALIIQFNGEESGFSRAISDQEKLFDTQVHDLHVFIFDSEGNIIPKEDGGYCYWHFSQDDFNQSGSVTLLEGNWKTVFADYEECDVYVVANLYKPVDDPDQMSDFSFVEDLTAVQTLNDLKELTDQNHQIFQPVSDIKKLFTMSGCIEKWEPLSSPNTCTLSVLLTRLAARIEVNVEINYQSDEIEAGYVVGNPQFELINYATKALVLSGSDDTFTDREWASEDDLGGNLSTESANQYVTYTYPNEWNADILHETYVLIDVPLTKNDETIDIKHNYYKVPLRLATDDKKLERNHWYKIKAKISSKGNIVPDNPVELTDVQYKVAVWKDMWIEVGNDNPMYLELSEYEVVMRNVDTYDLTFASSSNLKETEEKAEIEIKEIYYYNKDGKKIKITDSEILDNTYLKVEGDLNGKLTIHSPIPANKTIRYIELTVKNEQYKKNDSGTSSCIKTVTIMQYPLEYITGISGLYSYLDLENDDRYKGIWPTYKEEFVTKLNFTSEDGQYVISTDIQSVIANGLNNHIGTSVDMKSKFYVENASGEGRIFRIDYSYLDEYIEVPWGGTTDNPKVYVRGFIEVENSGNREYIPDKESDGRDKRYNLKISEKENGNYVKIGTDYIEVENGTGHYSIESSKDNGDGEYYFAYIHYTDSDINDITYYLCTTIDNKDYKPELPFYLSDNGTASNNQMYHVVITATSSDYTLARPIMNGDVVDAGNIENDNLVSPSFMLASQLGNSSTIRWQEAQNQCKNYVEVGEDGTEYDDWRLPTAAEIGILIRYQSDSNVNTGNDLGVMDNILNNADKGQNNPYYWVSSTDSYVEVHNSYNKDQHLKKGRDNDDDGCRVRCVRDYRISDE